MKQFIAGVLMLSLIFAGVIVSGPSLAESGKDEAKGSHKEDGTLKMSTAERSARGVKTSIVNERALSEVITAPGEVVINAYRSAKITSRIGAQVVARHARLGEAVTRDQALVTLSSVEVAQAQGDLIESDQEWRRVKELGSKVVSQKRYISAQVARQRAYATVRAYGMSKSQIKALLQSNDASRATGEFDLFSPQDGRVISDAFIVGEYVSPGQILLEITDVETPWVIAQLNPQDSGRVKVGAKVSVSRDGKTWLDGKVVQQYYRLDEATRTHPVRIEISNSQINLAAGEYVDVAIETIDASSSLAVPRQSLLLMNGMPTVFKLEGEVLRPQAVETGVIRAGWTEIKSGLTSGDVIVTEGAFLLKSLTLKSQMGEGH